MTSNFKKDPTLCDKCQQYGYCIVKANAKETENLRQKLKTLRAEKNRTLTEKEISNLVPIRTMMKGSEQMAGKKIQIAHDLFHENEFEQSNYIYQDIIQTKNDCIEAHIGLAASFYFLKKYEDATIIAERYFQSWYPIKTNQFILQCLNKLTEQTTTTNKSTKKKTTKNTLRNTALSVCETYA